MPIRIAPFHNDLKRRLIQTGGLNLGLLLRQLIGVGTRRGLLGRHRAVTAALLALMRLLTEFATHHERLGGRSHRSRVPRSRDSALWASAGEKTVFTTGC